VPQEEAEQDPERGPLRRCVVTRVQGERRSMLRFVVAPDGTVVPDLAARLPGRGIWLSARADVLSNPRLHSAFARAARRKVAMPDDLALCVEAGLRRRLVDLLGFARRAGQAVAGFQKVQEWLAAGRAALIVQASDGSTEERQRLIGRHRTVPVITPLPSASLGQVFARDVAVHVAVTAGGLAESLMIDAARLAGLGVGKAADTGTGCAETGFAEAGFAETGCDGAAGMNAPALNEDLDDR
jgi:predicted RNA-binding protein YlxR (DUF448 family)